MLKLSKIVNKEMVMLFEVKKMTNNQVSSAIFPEQLGSWLDESSVPNLHIVPNFSNINYAKNTLWTLFLLCKYDMHMQLLERVNNFQYNEPKNYSASAKH